MKKDISYYLGLPYTRELIPEPEGGWFVRIKELPGCMSQGETPEEAIQMINDAMRGWLEVELQKGNPIPEPKLEEEFSGKFVVRVPKSLHQKLVEIAEREGVSLNQWINSTLSEAVGKASIPHPERSSQDLQTSWPGLKSSVRHLLANLSMGNQAADLDERLFSEWLNRNLSDIRIQCEKEGFEEAYEKAQAMLILLEEYHQDSPILHSIYLLVSEILKHIEINLNMNQKVVQEQRLRQKISNVVATLYKTIESETLVSSSKRDSESWFEEEYCRILGIPLKNYRKS